MGKKSGKQVQLGKALEFATISALKNRYNAIYSKDSLENIEVAKGYFESIEENKSDFEEAAYAAIDIIDSLEPILSDNVASPLTLKLQSDQEGKKGDVRDIVCFRPGSNWEIGISCKHDNVDAKHSRLSRSLDFAKEWFGNEYHCSKDYYNETSPFFDLIDSKIKEGEENGYKPLWTSIDNKEEVIYVPLLKAFMKELNRLNEKYEDIPTKLVEYFLGKKDFYKFITNDENHSSTIEAFNLKGTLGRKSKTKKPKLRIAKLKLPTKFDCIEFKTTGKEKVKSKTTIRISCDEGWSFSLRIHNASERIERSLKFAIKIISAPLSVLVESKEWKTEV